jgi:hypothetical protein
MWELNSHIWIGDTTEPAMCLHPLSQKLPTAF